MVDNNFTNRLLSGERVLWSGRPSQGLLLTKQDIFLVPFSLIWCGFAVFWTVSAQSQDAPAFFVLFGGLFICIGLYFVIGRFLVDAWIRRSLRYAVTDRRILIDRPAPFNKFTALDLDQLPAVDLIEHANREGTIRFGPPVAMSGVQSMGMGTLTAALDPTPQFLAIADARRVFDLIQRAAGKQ